jgi:hypothetical protein
VGAGGATGSVAGDGGESGGAITMKTIRLEVELTYDEDLMHSGEADPLAKEWFLNEILLDPPSELVLHSQDVGDQIGDVKVLAIHEAGDPE